MSHSPPVDAAKAIRFDAGADAGRFETGPPSENARATNAKAAVATSKATSPATIRGRSGGLGGAAGSRLSMSRQSSGARILPNERNRSSRSGIVVLQELSETAAPSHQVHLHRRGSRPDDRGHLTHRVAAGVMEDDG